MISIWEKESFTDYDLIVIGAGITGMSTAASLKEKHPSANVLLLERGSLPTGASTKNAGFACFGSISEIAADRKTMCDDEMISLVNRRWLGLQKMIQRLGANNIGLRQQGGYELLNSTNAHHLHEIDEINLLLRPIFHQPVFRDASAQIPHFGFDNIAAMIFNPHEAQLHTGELIKSLWKYCSQLGIQIITGTPVKKLSEGPEHALVSTDSFTFKAKAVALCTNAFTGELIDQKLNLQPGRGMVLLIQPSKPLRFKGTFHYDEGYFYFRDLEGKILFGGGRNLYMEEETTTRFGINEKIEKKLFQDLQQIILPHTDFSVEMKWSGIMAFGDTKTPILKRLSPRKYLGVRLGGMGVALASIIGEELADEISENHF